MNAVRILGFIALSALSGAYAPVSANSVSNIGTDFQALDNSAATATVAAVINGSLDSHFSAANVHEQTSGAAPFWLRMQVGSALHDTVMPVLVVHAGLLHKVAVYVAGNSTQPLPQAARIPEFAGTHDLAFVLPAGSGRVYARIVPPASGSAAPRLSVSSLERVLDEGATRARMIAVTFGALAAMALSSLLIWIMLAESAFLLYGALFLLQALYVAYFSGQGFEWPLLSRAVPFTHYTWNVLSALGGAVACLFTREIADLRRYLPTVYSVFGWLAAAFVLVTLSNLAKLAGFESLINNLGNALFLGASIFTLVVAFIAWRRGSRPAGWFLIAWTLLEAFTIATTVRLLLNSSDEHDKLLYIGLPFAMVAAAILIALGIADRMREQRAALSEAERHAQIDSLTGALNRGSLIARLDVACAVARARGLSISLLFIDLDHFKEVNDSFGHLAGDACLAAIIPPIQTELRQSDVIGRYGGEEFVVILNSADAAAAHQIAQRILERVAAVRVEGFGPPIALTCSIGVASSDTSGVWGEKLIAQADAAVYVAKRSGRNRVELAMSMAA